MFSFSQWSTLGHYANYQIDKLACQSWSTQTQKWFRFVSPMAINTCSFNIK